MIRRSQRSGGSSPPVLMSSHLFLLALTSMSLVSYASASEGEEEVEPSVAVLFPWFAEVMGIIVFYILTRYIPSLPYTAVMFLIGTAMGIGAVRLNLDDHLTTSILQWDMIDSEVLLLVFLPGLIFSDAFGLNVHLFQVSLWQCVNFAFPMVLAGTCLTAIVGFFIFPYGWSWNLAMTFGSILSATDPVAVSSLMNEVGAPPRLKMHISGESLLNDGSAMVFYTIFSQMYLTELKVEGVGTTYTVGSGFALFFKMSLGAFGIGLAAGLALVAFLWLLNRRLNSEENVLQVAATITMAYLTYYVADAVCGTSGVIATLTCGVITRAFGAGMINDMELMENFWSLVEHLLNTLLFALGGVVWGTVIANPPGEPRFSSKDWGYLFLLYVMLHAYRFFLIFANYPITAHIGLGTNWRECIFSSFGGLRGAVGISLAIAIDNLVWEATTEEKYLEQTRTLFGMIGGIAFLTLVINGTTAGPVLRKLGLADIPAVRQKLIDRYHKRFKEHLVDSFVDGLSDPRFHNVDFALVKHHVPYLNDLTLEGLRDAIERQRGRVAPDKRKVPCIKYTVPYLTDKNDTDKSDSDPESSPQDLAWASDLLAEAKRESQTLESHLDSNDDLSLDDLPALQESDGNSDTTKELRSIFVEMLSYAYQLQVQRGELDTREGFVAYVLEEGLQFASDNANRGKPLSDWDMSEVVRQPWKDQPQRALDKTRKVVPVHRRPKNKRKQFGKDHHSKRETSTRVLQVMVDHEFEKLRYDVHRALAFIKAHRMTEEHFKAEFVEGSGKDMSPSEKIVLLESRIEVNKARAVLEGDGTASHKIDVEIITSHLLCQMLLNKAAAYITDLAEGGLLKAQEASGYVEEVEEHLFHLSKCSQHRHPGEKDREDRKEMQKEEEEEAEAESSKKERAQEQQPAQEAALENEEEEEQTPPQ